jgi:hypothetical protein
LRANWSTSIGRKPWSMGCRGSVGLCWRSLMQPMRRVHGREGALHLLRSTAASATSTPQRLRCGTAWAAVQLIWSASAELNSPCCSFLRDLRGRIYESDASKALQERLLKNSDRLFTFLHHDGVSWNNNLAENANKRISDIREDVGRSIRETGLSEQLVLLSLYQTCRV